MTDRRDRLVRLLATLIALVVFYLDFFHSLGHWVAAMAAVVVWLASVTGLQRDVRFAAIGCTVLTWIAGIEDMIGLLSGATAYLWWVAVVHRAIVTTAIWATAIPCLRLQSALADIGVKYTEVEETAAELEERRQKDRRRQRALLNVMDDLRVERERLAVSERRTRSTIDTALDAVVTIDEQGAIVDWNPQAVVVFGWTREQAMGRLLADLVIPEEFREAHSAGIARYLETGEGPVLNQRLELSALHRDGVEFPVELTISPIRLPDGTHFSAFVRDITERRRAEQRFRATVESAPTAMVMIDDRGTIVLVNSETEKLFGYEREALLGEPIEILVPVRFRPGHPDLRDGFLANPESRRMGAGRDLFGLHADGTEFPVEIGLNPVHTDEGLFVLSAIADITQRKELEEAQRVLNEELERRVEERTIQLETANEALEQSNVELQQFAYVASHDLQTPLRGIAGYAQFLQEDYSGQLDDTADDYIGRIVAGTERMKQLINDLLAYSRVQSRAAPFQATELDEVFDDAVDLLKASIEDVGATVTRGDLPTVSGDPAQLTQLLMNLVGNGIKYHGDAAPRVHVSAAYGDGLWTLTVEDNGIGIAPEHHEKVFEIFRRLHTQQEYPGTGIGLAVCSRIVTRHGGDIELDSTPGEGSRFSFTIPELGPSDGGNGKP